MVLLQRKLYFPKDPEGVQHFTGGSNFFQGGGGGWVQMLISIETHITCNFPGGSGPPIPPSGSAHGDVFPCWVVLYVYGFLFLKKLLKKYHQSDEQFGFRSAGLISVQTICKDYHHLLIDTIVCFLFISLKICKIT